MVECACEDAQFEEGRVEEIGFDEVERSFSEELVEKNDGAFSCGEVEVHVFDVFSDDVDLAYVAAAESFVVGDFDERYFQRIESHHVRRDRVDGDLVIACEEIVFDNRFHGSRPISITADGAVHDCEDAVMDFFLDL